MVCRISEAIMKRYQPDILKASYAKSIVPSGRVKFDVRELGLWLVPNSGCTESMLKFGQSCQLK